MLISPEYRDIQAEMHRNPGYGVASVQYAPLVADTVRRYRFEEFLDYGAGKGRLATELEWLVPWPIRVQCYDPAVSEWSAKPEPNRFVACIDVLEHIEPLLLSNVLDDLQRVTAELGLFTVHCGLAKKFLPDGRNAHLIQQPAKWWLPQFLERFELVQFTAMAHGFWVLVGRRHD